jgi:drug/metabolite transporter (DMT)-like permease
MVTLVYGSNYVIIKFVSPNPVGPSGLVLMRTIMAVVFFWVAGFFIKGKKIDKEDWPRILLCAFCGSAFNQLCFFQGAVNTSPIDASLIMTTNPIIVMLFAAVILKEKLTKNKFIGIALGCLGAILIIMQKEGNHNAPDRLYGNTMIFVNSILFGLYIVIVKPLITKYDTITLMKWIFLLGLLLLIPFGYEETMAVDWNFSIYLRIGHSYLFWLRAQHSRFALGIVGTGKFLLVCTAHYCCSIGDVVAQRIALYFGSFCSGTHLCRRVLSGQRINLFLCLLKSSIHD